MKKYGKFTSLVALLVAFTMVLSACGQPAAAPTPTTAPAAEATPTQPALTEQPTNTPAAEATPTEALAAQTPAATGEFDPTKVQKIEVEQGAVLRVSGWGNPSEQKVTQDMLNRFTQVYPNVQIKYEPIPEDYQTKLKTQISGGTEPDVFYVDAVLADELIGANKLLKLNEYMDQAGRKKSDYYDSLINIFSRGEDVYGLPKDFGSLAVFYNVDLVKEKPKEGWKWDDYRAWAQANTQGTDPNTKVFGTMHPPDNARWLAFAFANGAKIESINSPEAVESLDFYYGMVKDGIAGQAADVGAGWPGEAFGKKRAAAVIEGGWMVPFLADPAGGFSDVKYEAAPLPASNKGGRGNLIFTNAYSASANTKYPKAAAALVLFLAGAENQREVLRIGFALPTLKSLANDPYFKDHPVDAVLFDSVNYGTVHYFGPNHGKILDAINTALEKVFRGQADSKTALDEAADTISGLLK
jgi:multiple sugar transport system substrate-binding protein